VRGCAIAPVHPSGGGGGAGPSPPAAASDRDHGDGASVGSLDLEPQEYEWLEQQLAHLGEVTLQDEEDSEAWQDPSGGPLGDALAACEAGEIDALRAALAALPADASIHTPGPDGDMCIHIACLYGHEACVSALLEAGAAAGAVNPEDGSTPLHDAAAGGYTAIMRRLLEAGAEVQVADAEGDTPLHNAARGDHLEAVTMLLGAGASPKVRPPCQRPPPPSLTHGSPPLLCGPLCDVLPLAAAPSSTPRSWGLRRLCAQAGRSSRSARAAAHTPPPFPMPPQAKSEAGLTAAEETESPEVKQALEAAAAASAAPA
jgi:hypothetical protein